ncbi:MAG: hypothetical protein E6R03_16450 [Hyphomicrobiaceae bacterium]|nr:MAG: hypothetical protein E6R03_16450 [Hyphomicrobiaceae bacterium]
MNFQSAPRTENYLIRRYVSEHGRWEVGLSPVLFGVRVRASLVGEAWCDVDYCAGDDWAFAAELLATVVIILESFPESVSGREVNRALPQWHARPINKDDCWPKLQAMAAEILARKESVAA